VLRRSTKHGNLSFDQERQEMTNSTEVGSTVTIVKEGDGIAWVYLNRPEKINAMSPKVHRDMSAAFDALEVDDEVHVVVIGGAGGNFSAGQDLKEFFRDLETDPQELYLMEQRYCKWRWDRLLTFPKLTIAMVEGWCIGGAFTHLIACDFAIASEDAKFSLSEVNWGIIPGGMVTKAVVDSMGYREGLYYVLTGETFSANRAQEVGLVNFTTLPNDLHKRVQEFAEMLMKKNQNVARATKEVYRMIRRGMDNDQALDYLSAKFVQLKATDPTKGYSTGLSAFVDKKAYRPVDEPYPAE
jgi:trans-feruloyl-CoA hydratase/vanillin synthase